MKKVALTVISLLAAVALSGCAMVAPVVPPPAMIQSYQAPLDLDNDQTQLGSKKGTASTQNVLGIVSWGDGSTRAAATDGGISTIRSADYEFFSVFGIYSKYTTIVHGD
ncbi:MAG: TRL domain-containing protein [Myxococcota bacterium]